MLGLLAAPGGAATRAAPAGGRARRTAAAAAAKGGGGKPRRKRKGQGGKQQDKVSESALEAEPHKYFDEATVHVRAGRGGDGAAFAPGELGSDEELPRGARGGNVVLYVSAAHDDLLHLRRQDSFKARNGKGADRGAARNKARTPRSLKEVQLAEDSRADVRVPVPPGTFVRAAGSGAPLGDLLRVGQSLVVASGGQGGHSYRRLSREGRARRDTRSRRAEEEKGVYAVFDDDSSVAEEVKGGLDGEARSLNLTLRVMADVGLVGLPNAGKSSLLAATTAASPEVAPYPFTTLVPNLGILESKAEEEEGAPDDGGGFDDPFAFNPFAGATAASSSSDMAGGAGAPGGGEKGVQERPPVLADLPGLIAGAHVGKGLGRVFLRHLRRSRVLLHVVDCSAQDPLGDYYAIRRELWMYNPEYCARPHVVALNKTDVEGVNERAAEIAAALEAGATDEAELRYANTEGGSADSDGGDAGMRRAPFRCVLTSARERVGIGELRGAISDALATLPAPKAEPTIAMTTLERQRAGGRKQLDVGNRRRRRGGKGGGGSRSGQSQGGKGKAGR